MWSITLPLTPNYFLIPLRSKLNLETASLRSTLNVSSLDSAILSACLSSSPLHETHVELSGAVLYISFSFDPSFLTRCEFNAKKR